MEVVPVFIRVIRMSMYHDSDYAAKVPVSFLLFSCTPLFNTAKERVNEDGSVLFLADIGPVRGSHHRHSRNISSPPS